MVLAIGKAFIKINCVAFQCAKVSGTEQVLPAGSTSTGLQAITPSRSDCRGRVVKRDATSAASSARVFGRWVGRALDLFVGGSDDRLGAQANLVCRALSGAEAPTVLMPVAPT